MRISSGGGEASAASPVLVPDVAMAGQFLRILDPTAAGFHFQTFADQKGARGTVAAPLAQGIYGALETLAGHLGARNRQGAGIFVAVNALVPDKPRRKAHVQRVRAVFLDLDALRDTLPPFPLEPHLVVESSPRRHHVYWLVEGLPVDQFAPLQQALARRYQGDPVVSDACRVMRLPGFYHRKDPARPVLARLIAHGLHPPYAPEQIRDSLLGEAAGAPLPATIQESTPAATRATLDHARRLAQEAARRTREDPRLSRHAEVVRLGHYLRRDGIPLTRRVGQLVLDELLAHLRPTAAGSGEAEPFPREEAARALRDAYRAPSEPDRPRAVPLPLSAVSGGEEDWPDPGIISLAPAGRVFPLEALPPSARAAVAECQRYGQQPLPLVAGAALGAMALATQGHADVARDALLRGPSSLNLLILGESGERKSAADAWFTGPLRAWQEEKAQALAGKRRQDAARIQLNEERRRSVRAQLAQLEIKPAPSTEPERVRLQARLDELEAEAAGLVLQPLPTLTYEEATPEGLAFAVATGWPSAALISDEAGLIIGGRGMSDENALGFLSLLNRLWDGRPYRPTRKVAAAPEIRGRRFSSSLMLQPELLGKISEKGGRGVGFLARYLICHPPSTMGTRLYIPPPKGQGALAAFHARLIALLDLELPVNDRFELKPPVMAASRGAHEIWRSYHDATERQLGKFGLYANVKDVGAKSAENAARLACSFQVWERGPGGELLPECMAAGVAVARWFLDDTNRLLFEAQKPVELSDAELLSEWLTSLAPTLTRGGAPVMVDGRLALGDILRLGPYRLRDKGRRDEALRLLSPEGMDDFHLRLEGQGRRKELVVNPKLLPPHPR